MPLETSEQPLSFYDRTNSLHCRESTTHKQSRSHREQNLLLKILGLSLYDVLSGVRLVTILIFFPACRSQLTFLHTFGLASF
jgi:hypothetical protein